MVKSAKLDSLPDDLRGIAEAMLREKFPEKKPEAFNYGFTQSNSVSGTLTEQSLIDVLERLKEKPAPTLTFDKIYEKYYELLKDNIEPETLVLSPKGYNDIMVSPEAQWATHSSPSDARIMGMDVEISPHAKDVFIKPRGYGKSYHRIYYSSERNTRRAPPYGR